MNGAEGEPVTTVTIAGPGLRRFLDGLPGVDSVGAEARAAVLASRSIKTTAKRVALDLAISMIDLTTLEGQDTPGKVRAMCAKAKHPDPTDPTVPGPLIDRIAREVGPPDILVNTIGAFTLGDALAATPDALRLMIDINLGSALWLSQAAARHMQRTGKGTIVHVAARPGLDPTGGMAAYSVSKAALVHLVRTLDVELRPHGIRVNAVAPQLLDTARNRALFPAEMMAQAVDPQAIADIIAFLVSDAAAPVSGAILPAYGP